MRPLDSDLWHPDLIEKLSRPILYSIPINKPPKNLHTRLKRDEEWYIPQNIQSRRREIRLPHNPFIKSCLRSYPPSWYWLSVRNRVFFFRLYSRDERFCRFRHH